MAHIFILYLYFLRAKNELDDEILVQENVYPRSIFKIR